MTITLAMFGCAHLGYAPKNSRRTLPHGTAVVAADGYNAYQTVIREVVDLSNSTDSTVALVNGGDLFHTPRPSIEAVNVALDADRIRAEAGIARFDIPGNHDRAGAATLPATAVLAAQPNTHVVAPIAYGAVGDAGGEIVSDGLYHIHTLTDGDTIVYLHLVNEQALCVPADDRAPEVDPQPRAGGVNVLVTHGILTSAEGVAEYHHGADERGGNRVIPRDWLRRGFDLAMLSDFHSPTSGQAEGETPWFYTGSLVRRGFSDAETQRGWSSVTITSNGVQSLDFHPVAQRPAFDLVVKATGLTDPEDIAKAVTSAVADVPDTDTDSEARTGDGGTIIRVTITDVEADLMDDVRSRIPEWNRRLAPGALWLQVRATGDARIADAVSEVSESLPAVGEETMGQAFSRMADAGTLATLDDLDTDTRRKVIDECLRLLG